MTKWPRGWKGKGLKLKLKVNLDSSIPVNKDILQELSMTLLSLRIYYCSTDPSSLSNIIFIYMFLCL